MATLVKRPAIASWALLIISALLLFTIPCRAESGSQESFQIRALEWTQTADDFVLAIKGGTAPTYTMYELFDPFRVTIDIANASFDPLLDTSANLPQGPVSKITSRMIEDKDPFIARIEFFVADDSSYTVDRLANDIIIKFAKQPSTDAPMGKPMAAPDSELTTETITDDVSPPPLPLSPDSDSVEIAAAGEQQMGEETMAPATTAAATVLFDIEVEHSATETRVFLRANGPIKDYNKVALAKDIKANRPDRIYFDIKNVNLAGPIQPQIVGTALAQVRSAARTDGTRIVFDSSLDELFEYQVSEQPDGLLVTIKEPSAATSVIAGLLNSKNTESDPATSPEPQAMGALEQTESPATELPTTLTLTEETPVAPSNLGRKKPSSQKETAATLAFAGYTKQRITVDFYKIDLHNVFRLFGEISNLNMVVDQAVSGSLTLALNDVPWDFALDIILNLKDLRKEERYNTIVISPKSKKFEWPEKTLESVEFKTDETFDLKQQEEDSIKISQQQEIPEAVIQAKNLIHQAQNSEKLGNYTAALALYEDSFAKWPENTIIAKRIASLCLVRLGQNAKAVHYAKVALKADPNDYDSAVQAAIGLARMQKTDQAKDYFEKSVSGPLPSSAALSSYAAFSEELQQFDRALALLKQHEEIHGDTLETMISKARIHDKQGQRESASAAYQAILLSGYEIPKDLARYIKGRASLAVQ